MGIKSETNQAKSNKKTPMIASWNSAEKYQNIISGQLNYYLNHQLLQLSKRNFFSESMHDITRIYENEDIYRWIPIYIRWDDIEWLDWREIAQSNTVVKLKRKKVEEPVQTDRFCNFHNWKASGRN